MQYRVKFDFELFFTNGGGLKGEDFRLDIEGTDISDSELIDYIVKDLQLLMVGKAAILNKQIIQEPHKRKPKAKPTGNTKYIDLSHTIENGLVTYKGLPAPIICDYLSRADSRKHYQEGTEFQIGKIEMVSNTGTYLDCPFHRYENGKDLSEILVEQVTDLEGIKISVLYERSLAIELSHVMGHEVRGRAVLLHTDWSKHWNTEAYFEGHPYLTEEAAAYLRDCGVKLVGIDSHNIDNTATNSRPAHSILLGAGILIVEHMCHLDLVPHEGFTFTALPPKFKGVGTFPVRAIAKVY